MVVVGPGTFFTCKRRVWVLDDLVFDLLPGSGDRKFGRYTKTTLDPRLDLRFRGLSSRKQIK